MHMLTDANSSPRASNVRSDQKSVGTDRRTIGIRASEIRILMGCLNRFMLDAELLLEVDLSRDWKTIQHRSQNEGFGFISKILPEFLQWFRRCIEVGLFTPCPKFKTFRTLKGAYPYPAFLRGLVRLFSNDNGEIIIAVTPAQLERQRQAFTVISTICQSFGAKYEVPLPEESLDAQIRENFRFDEEETFQPQHLDHLSDDVKEVLVRAKAILSSVFEPYIKMGLENGEECLEWRPIEHVFDLDDVKPRHGTGAVAQPCKPHEKYTRFITFPTRYGTLGPYSDLVPQSQERSLQIPLFTPETSGEIQAMHDLLLGGVGRMSVVPKNAKKGRPINLEQTEFQFAQQGVRLSLYDWLEKNPITGGYVNFTNQEINGKLALKASRTGFHATLDLKAASDSVTRTHVSTLFESWLTDELNALRSRFTRAKVNVYQKGKRVGEEELFRENEKYAPMGSALCFPVESLVFWAVTKAALELSTGSKAEVWVYGDDLIFPASGVEFVISVLAELRIKVNREKSFWKGLFRESCGTDAFDGVAVTPPLRISTRLPISSLGQTPSQRSSSIVAWVEYANTFEEAGYPAVSRYLRKTVWELFPSSRSYPSYKDKIPRGYLYWLNYSASKDPYPRGTIDNRLVLPLKMDQTFKFSPWFPKHPCKTQGELFKVHVPNVLFGEKCRLWTAGISPYQANLSENNRLLRYWLEGDSELPGNWFVDRNDFRLNRKPMILT